MEGTPGDNRHVPFGVGTGWIPTLGLAVVVAIAYFLAARLGLALRAQPGVAVFWPAAGIAVGTLIAWGPSGRLPVAGAAMVATALSNLMTGRNAWLAVAFGLVNVGQCLLTAWLIERAFGSTFKLGNVLQVLGLLVASAIGAAAAAACAAAAVSLVEPAAPMLNVWRLWFASCLLGIVTVAPLPIGLGEAVRDPPPRRELIEGTLGLATLTAVTLFAISLPQGLWATALPVALVFPLLLWVVVRCRPVFAAAAAFVVALAVVWSTTFNMGHFGDASVPLADRILAAQTVVLVGALLAFVLAALFAERRQSEAALKQSTERLQLALDGAALGTFNVEIATGRLECDVRAASIHGHASLPLTLKEGRRFILPDDLVRVDAGFAEALRAGGVWKAEYRVVHPPDHTHAGEVRWIALDGSIVRNSPGTPVRWLGVTHDITERKETELALAERDAQLALAGKTALVGSYALDVNSGRVQVSPGCAVIHGFPEGTGEIQRDDWRAGVQPDDLARYDRLLSQAFAERQSEYHVEYRILRSGGEVRWIEARAFILYDDDGRGERVVGINIDVTERKKAEAALEESDARYRALYHDNPSMYFTVDALGTVLSVNEFGARQLGYAPAELVGRSVLQLIHEEDREVARQRLASCGENPETIARAELRKVRRDGSILWVREVARAVREPGGQTVLLIVCEDITDLKWSEEQQNLLIAELDHRVKNTLANVAVVARRTGERRGSTADFIQALDHRLQSMAEAHALLSRSRWQGVSLADLVGRELAPYATAGNTVVEGPYVGLTAAATQAMAMVLHELGTNAAKYGALSTPQGRVLVRWGWRSNGGAPATLALEWHEQGGPAVTVPAQAGYGTSVIRDLIPYELGGTVELEFAPDGVRCAVVIPSEQARLRDPVANPIAELAAVRR